MERSKNKLVKLTYPFFIKSVVLVAILHLVINTNAQNSYSSLYSAYINKSDSALIRYIEKWQTESKPISKNELLTLNQYEQEAYQLFNDFYNQTGNVSVAKSNPYHFLFTETKYLLVQSSLKIYKENINEIGGPGKLVSEIKNFRPFVNFNDNMVLVRTDKYESSLIKFLYPKIQNNDSLQNTDSLIQAERLNRINFLGKYISFYNPKFEYIIFEKQRQFETIHIIASTYITYDIYMKKIKNKWIFVYVSTTII